MTGIAGLVGLGIDRREQLLSQMSAPLAYNVSDVVERFDAHAVAMCRVAIQSPAGHPGSSMCQRFERCLIFYGELVGRTPELLEMRRRGHEVEDRISDAELCLRLFEEFGQSCLLRLNGSFCLALFDGQSGELVLASDRLGSRPIFHARTVNGRFAFSTQVSSILATSEMHHALDKRAVFEFFANQRVFGTKTYHQGIDALPAGSVLSVRDGSVRVSSYWKPRYRAQEASLDEYAEQLAVTIRDAVDRMSAGGGRLGVLLSGGLDARMIVAAARSELSCFTFADYENFESSVARQVAEARGFRFDIVTRPDDQYVDMIDAAVEIGSGMHPFNHAHALGLLDDIRKQCNPLTHGYGTEIMFRGSSLPYAMRRAHGVDVAKVLDPTLSETTLRERLLARSNSLLNKGVLRVFRSDAVPALRSALTDTVDELLASCEGHAETVFDKFIWPDIHFRGRFPSFIFQSSIRHYMSEASIDFDNEVIDLHLRMPVQVRSGNALWVRAMERLNAAVARLPSANTGYSPLTSMWAASLLDLARRSIRLPTRRESLMRTWARKHGGGRDELSPISWPRFDTMIRRNRRLQERLRSTLQDPEALPAEIFDHAQIAALLDSHLRGRSQERDILFALLTFGTWHKKHFA